jgi:hypothetical protein
MARLMGQWLSVRLRQPFVVENRPGVTYSSDDEIAAKMTCTCPPSISTSAGPALR